MSSPVAKKLTNIPISITNRASKMEIANDGTLSVESMSAASPGMALLSRALVNVEQVLVKNEEALQAVKDQLTKLSNQRIGLLSQKNMLIELKTQLERDELDSQKIEKE